MAISLLFNRYCIVSFKFPPRRPSPQAPNRFLAQSSARFGLQNGFWCNPWHVLGFKSVFGVKRGSPRASDQFLAQNEGRRGFQISFWPNPRVISHQKQDLGPRRPSFYGTRVGAQQHTAPAGAGKFAGYQAIHVPGKIRRRPQTPVCNTPLHRVPGQTSLGPAGPPRELIVSSSRFILPMPLSICSRRRQ